MLAESAVDYINMLRKSPDKSKVEHNISSVYAKNIRYYLGIIESVSIRKLEQPFTRYDELRKLAIKIKKGNKSYRFIQRDLGLLGYSYKVMLARLELIEEMVSTDNFLNGILIPSGMSTVQDHSTLISYLADWFLLLRTINIKTIEEFVQIAPEDNKEIYLNEFLRWNKHTGSLFAIMATITMNVMNEMEFLSSSLMQLKEDAELGDLSLIQKPVLEMCSEACVLNNIRGTSIC